MKKEEREKIIDDYRAAYLMRHGREVTVTYKNGWVTIGESFFKKRVRELPPLTKHLLFLAGK